jgi:hypothetical protein
MRTKVKETLSGLELARDIFSSSPFCLNQTRSLAVIRQIVRMTSPAPYSHTIVQKRYSDLRAQALDGYSRSVRGDNDHGGIDLVGETLPKRAFSL